MTLLLTAARALQGDLVLLRVLLVATQVPGMLVLSGAAQQRALRFRLPGETRWFRLTALGVLMGVPVGIGLAFLVGYLVSLADRIRMARTLSPETVPGDASPGGLFALMGILMLAAILVSTALAQWRVLQCDGRWAGWWPAIGALGWAIALLVASRLMFPDRHFLQALFSYMIDEATSMEHPPRPVRVIASPLVLGLIAGAITGAGLIYILRARPPVVTHGKPSHPQREAR
jgi:hypothetical protein